MEKKVYYGVLENKGWEEGKFLKPKVFIHKDLAQEYADKLHIEAWRRKIKSGRVVKYDDIDEVKYFLLQNQIDLHSQISDGELKSFFRLLEVEIKQAEDSFFLQELLLFNVIEIPSL